MFNILLRFIKHNCRKSFNLFANFITGKCEQDNKVQVQVQAQAQVGILSKKCFVFVFSRFLVSNTYFGKSSEQ